MFRQFFIYPYFSAVKGTSPQTIAKNFQKDILVTVFFLIFNFVFNFVRPLQEGL